MRIACIALALAVISPTVAATELTSRVTTTDGDTIRMGEARIRLWGFDAPERGQICALPGGSYLEAGRHATEALAAFIGNQFVTCETVDIDRYGRVVATCAVAGADLGSMMVRSDWAWDYARYSGGHYRQAEAEAQQARRGIWAAECVPAWEWRRR